MHREGNDRARICALRRSERGGCTYTVPEDLEAIGKEEAQPPRPAPTDRHRTLLVAMGVLALSAQAVVIALLVDVRSDLPRDVGERPTSSTMPGVHGGRNLAPVRACPNSRHIFEMPPGEDNESGDGLPPSGTATSEAAERAEDGLRRQFHAIASQIVEVDGRAWRRSADGEVEIVPEGIFTVRLTLEDPAGCPGGPMFAGVPVTFEYQVPQ